MAKMQSSPIHVVILAAGKSTRMNSDIPKVLHKVAHLQILSWVLATARALSPASINLVLGPDQDPFKGFLTNYPEITIVTQPQPNGTGGAVSAANLPAEGIVVVLYGDTPFIQPYTINTLVLQVMEDPLCGAAILGFEKATPNSYGRFVLDKAGHLTHIVEAANATVSELNITLCNAGFMAVRAELLAQALAKLQPHPPKNELYLTDIISWMHKNNHHVQHTVCAAAEVIGVNTRAELVAAEAIAQENLRAKLLEAGITMPQPQTVTLSADTVVGQDTVIEPYVIIGPGVMIGAQCLIRGFSYLEDCEIANKVNIGPYARIRPGSVLEDNVRVGNFVEIKKSVIGAGSKIPHLSYIGDTEMGESCNIGAGTITCNYDGKNKHLTKLGNRVFVGSNNSLIAPINLGDDSMTGAGSVITKDVSAKELAVSRAEQRNVPKRKS